MFDTDAIIPKRSSYEPHIWGPHFWFFLHTIAMSYPDNANEVTRKKYYDLIQNLPLFIPDAEMGNRFSRVLDNHPVAPYLGKRESFIRWTVFIHNKINVVLGKSEFCLEDAIEQYNQAYIPEKLELYGDTSIKKNTIIIYSAIILALLLVAYMVYF